MKRNYKTQSNKLVLWSFKIFLLFLYSERSYTINGLTNFQQICYFQNLLEVLETTKQRERHVAKLQSEIQALDQSRAVACNDLRQTKLSVESLNATVETLSAVSYYKLLFLSDPVFIYKF